MTAAMDSNDPNVPASLRLCRSCPEPHYWDRDTGQPVAEEEVPQPSFVLEAACDERCEHGCELGRYGYCPLCEESSPAQR